MAQDPELPHDPNELLFFVLIEFNMESMTELARVAEMELTGSLTSEVALAFVDAPWHHFESAACAFP